MKLIFQKTLEWAPWTWYQTQKVGGKVLQACDYAGEKIADFLGITGPKYHFEIEEYKRTLAMENEMREKEEKEMVGWYDKNQSHLLQKNVINQSNVGTYI